MTRIGIVYGRTSHEKDDAFSVDSQIEYCLEDAAQEGIHIPEAYVFREDHSGAKYNRPEFDKVKKLLRSGKIDVMFIYQPDRLARKVGIAEQFLDEYIHGNDIQLRVTYSQWYVRNTADDYGRFYDEMTFAAKERLRIIERFTRGKARKIASGLPHGQGPIDKFGYRIVGRKKNTHIERVEEELTIVTRIFDLYYNHHMGVADMEKIFNDAAVPTPSQTKGMSWLVRSKWDKQTFYNILKSEDYTGRFYVNRFTTAEGKKVMRPRNEWILLEFPELRIISDDVFYGTQKLLAERRTFSGETKYEYLLSRRITCQCGRAVGGRTKRPRQYKNGVQAVYTYYCCSGREDGNGCQMPSLTAEVVEGKVWQSLEDFFADPATRITTLNAIADTLANNNAELTTELDSVNRFRAEYTQTLNELYQDYKDRMITKEIYLLRKGELDRRLEALEQIEEENRAKSRGMLTHADIQRIDRFCRGMFEEYRGYDEFRERVKLVDMLQLAGELVSTNGRVMLYLYAHDTHLTDVTIDDDSGALRIFPIVYPSPEMSEQTCNKRFLVAVIPLA